jgi:hypothetical protein
VVSQPARREPRAASQLGYSLLEISVALACFGIFLWIVVVVTAEMRGQEKRYPVNFMSHPEVGGVVARLRRDIFDTKSYPADYAPFTQTSQTLILYTIQPSGFGETVVYDFRQKGEVHRYAYSAGAQTSHWIARGVPQFAVDALDLEDTNETAVHVTAADASGQLAIDQYIFPRPHE